MGLNPLNAFITRRILAVLRPRAYSLAELERLATESASGAARSGPKG